MNQDQLHLAHLELAACALLTPQASEEKTISLRDAVHLVVPSQSVHGFDFNFSGSFMSIRKILDPDSQTGPTWFTERFLDDSNHSLISHGDLYKQMEVEEHDKKQHAWYSDSESDSEDYLEEEKQAIDARLSTSLDSLVQGTHVPDGSAGMNLDSSLLHSTRLVEYSSESIDSYLEERGVDRTNLSPILSYQVLRWTCNLRRTDVATIDMHLDSVLLASGWFYDVGTIRFRSPSKLTPASIRAQLSLISVWNDIMVDNKRSLTKLCVAASGAGMRRAQSKLHIPDYFRPYVSEEAHLEVREYSSQWAEWVWAASVALDAADEAAGNPIDYSPLPTQTWSSVKKNKHLKN